MKIQWIYLKFVQNFVVDQSSISCFAQFFDHWHSIASDIHPHAPNQFLWKAAKLYQWLVWLSLIKGCLLRLLLNSTTHISKPCALCKEKMFQLQSMQKSILHWCKVLLRFTVQNSGLSCLGSSKYDLENQKMKPSKWKSVQL